MSGNTQYNELVDGYSRLYPPGGETCPDYPIAAVEAHQLYLAVTNPKHAGGIQGKHVLDLACGAGYYASKLLSWGATSVTGVDISSEMISRARQVALSRGISESELKYMVGDASDETLTISSNSNTTDRSGNNTKGGKVSDAALFDVVTGCWLLNYAPDAPTMAKMWRNIGRHLKPGGVWVGLTVPPLPVSLSAEKPESLAWARQMLDYAMSPEGPWGQHGDGGKIIGSAPDGNGFKMRTDLYIPGASEDVLASFENYYLSLDVFEQSCAETQMFEGLEWCDFAIPEEVKQGRSVGFWNDLSLFPHCRVFTAKRR